jgi:hypothetical protein
MTTNWKAQILYPITSTRKRKLQIKKRQYQPPHRQMNTTKGFCWCGRICPRFYKD